MRSTSLAHALWKTHLKEGDTAIDATCGNGHDALVLAELVGTLHCIDRQEAAIAATKERLGERDYVHYHLGSHATFPEGIAPNLIVYNLGYLPGGDKKVTTETDSTLMSLHNGLEILAPGGMISLMCYPGHPEGARETEAVERFLAELSGHEWTLHNGTTKAHVPKLYTISSG